MWSLSPLNWSGCLGSQAVERAEPWQLHTLLCVSAFPLIYIVVSSGLSPVSSISQIFFNDLKNALIKIILNQVQCFVGMESKPRDIQTRLDLSSSMIMMTQVSSFWLQWRTKKVWTRDYESEISKMLGARSTLKQNGCNRPVLVTDTPDSISEVGV